MPDLAALKSAARAAIVIPAVFALADKVIEQPQTSLIAAFGSFALLVFVDFAGPPRTRLVAYVALACVGAAFITLGTLCSRSPWLAAGAMAAVPTTFATFFNNVAVAGGPGPARAYIEELMPDVLEGAIEPGRVFDRTIALDEVPDGYRAMNDRESIKVMIAL